MKNPEGFPKKQDFELIVEKVHFLKNKTFFHFSNSASNFLKHKNKKNLGEFQFSELYEKSQKNVNLKNI